MCIARRALNGVDGVLSVVCSTLSKQREEMARCRGVARTIPPGGYKKFRLGWVWGGVQVGYVSSSIYTHTHSNL